MVTFQFYKEFFFKWLIEQSVIPWIRPFKQREESLRQDKMARSHFRALHSQLLRVTGESSFGCQSFKLKGEEEGRCSVSRRKKTVICWPQRKVRSTGAQTSLCSTNPSQQLLITSAGRPAQPAHPRQQIIRTKFWVGLDLTSHKEKSKTCEETPQRT